MKPVTVHVKLKHFDDFSALVVRVGADSKWLEVRGRLDVDANDPLQKVLDSLSGPLVGGELMAGSSAAVTPTHYARDYPVLLALVAANP